jgi:hypothetical protein
MLEKEGGLPEKESQIAFFLIISGALIASTIGLIVLLLQNGS